MELRDADDKLIEETKQRQQIEERLAQSQKMEAVGTLAGGIAHDFNNMLAVIMGNAELAHDEVGNSMNGIGHQLDQILKASRRASDLVKQILAFSRKQQGAKRPFSLIPLVKETAKMLRGTLPSTIEIKVDAVTDFDTVLADPSQLQQVIMNLSTNADHVMREDGGVLTIGVSDVTIGQNDPKPDEDMQSGRYVRPYRERHRHRHTQEDS